MLHQLNLWIPCQTSILLRRVNSRRRNVSVSGSSCAAGGIPCRPRVRKEVVRAPRQPSFGEPADRTRLSAAALGASSTLSLVISASGMGVTSLPLACPEQSGRPAHGCLADALGELATMAEKPRSWTATGFSSVPFSVTISMSLPHRGHRRPCRPRRPSPRRQGRRSPGPGAPRSCTRRHPGPLLS